MRVKPHSQRALAVAGGILAYYFVGIGVATRFSDTPLVAQSIVALPSVFLFGWLAKKEGVFQGIAETGIPSVLLILPPFLFLIWNWSANPIEDYPMNGDNVVQILRVVIFCLLVGLGEELLFRGYVFSLCSRWNLSVALIVSSTVFGLLHYFDNGWSGVVLALAFGFGLGLARIARTPIWVLVLVHALINLPVELPSSEPLPYAVHFGWAVFWYTVFVTIAFLAVHWRGSHKSAISSRVTSRVD